jgi:hypothetical protein
MTRPLKTTEAETLRACLTLLEWLRIPAWRANCGAAKHGDRYVRYGEPGQPDVLGILPGGRLLCLECKSSVGRLRPEQKAWLARAEGAGALCVVARSIDDLAAALRSAGVKVS